MVQATLAFLIISTLVVSAHAGPIFGRHNSMFGAGGNNTYEDLSRRKDPVVPTGRHFLRVPNAAKTDIVALMREHDLHFKLDSTAQKFNTFIGSFDIASKAKLNTVMTTLAGKVTSFVEYTAIRKETIDNPESSWPILRVTRGTPAQSHDVAKHTKYHPSAGSCATTWIIDSGVMENHHEFEGRMTWAAVFVPEGDDARHVDNVGHGTQVASLVGGKTFGLAKRAKMFAIKIGNESIRTGDIILALNHVALKYDPKTSGLTIVNLSVGTASPCPVMNSAVDDLVKLGVHVVTAAGNDRTLADQQSPGGSDGAIVVGGSTFNDHMWIDSSYGPRVDILAPAHEVPAASIKGPDANTSLNPSSGTSLSSPLVAGLLAYVGCHPELQKKLPLPHAGKETGAYLRNLALKAPSPYIQGPPKVNTVKLIAYAPP